MTISATPAAGASAPVHRMKVGIAGLGEVPVEGIHDERMAELDEMYQALTTDRPVRHDGRWGSATLEVVLAIRQSALERQEIRLSHQCDAY